MTTLRLLRRSLLCLIVGLLAFGLSGWLLRPRPTWTATIPLPSPRASATPLHSIEPNPAAPIWLTLLEPSRGALRDDDAPRRILALDPTTGAVTANFTCRERLLDDADVLRDGSLLLVDRKSGDAVPSERFERFNGRSDQPTASYALEGAWRLAPNERSLWRLKPMTNGFEFVQVSLADGRPEHSFVCPNHYPFYGGDETALSKDGRWLALCVRDEAGHFSSRTVEIWNVPEARLLRTLALPPWFQRDKDEEDGGRTRLRFTGARLELRLRADSTRLGWSLWSTPVTAGAFVAEADSLPAAAELPAAARLLHVKDPTPGREVWLADDHARLWFLVRGEDETILPWKEVPYPLQWGFSDVFSTGAGIDCAFAAVPGRDAIVCMTVEPSLATSLPDALQQRLPTTWKEPFTIRTRWHDWRTGAWRNVGLPDEQQPWQLRPDACISRHVPPTVEAHPLLRLQSWPLPPRDPKWPAAAVALLCVILTWRLCARRASRLRKLAA